MYIYIYIYTERKRERERERAREKEIIPIGMYCASGQGHPCKPLARVAKE